MKHHNHSRRELVLLQEASQDIQYGLLIVATLARPSAHE
jgi:hypothetical protein